MMKHCGSFRGSVSVGVKLSLDTRPRSYYLGFSAVPVLCLRNTADGGISQQCEITLFKNPTSIVLTAHVYCQNNASRQNFTWEKLLIVLWKSVINIADFHLSQNGNMHKCYQTTCKTLYL